MKFLGLDQCVIRNRKRMLTKTVLHQRMTAEGGGGGGVGWAWYWAVNQKSQETTKLLNLPLTLTHFPPLELCFFLNKWSQLLLLSTCLFPISCSRT